MKLRTQRNDKFQFGLCPHQNQPKELKWYSKKYKKKEQNKSIHSLTLLFPSFLFSFSLYLLCSSDRYIFADFNDGKGTSVLLTIKAKRYHSLAAIGSDCHKIVERQHRCDESRTSSRPRVATRKTTNSIYAVGSHPIDSQMEYIFI